CCRQSRIKQSCCSKRNNRAFHLSIVRGCCFYARVPAGAPTLGRSVIVLSPPAAESLGAPNACVVSAQAADPRRIFQQAICFFDKKSMGRGNQLPYLVQCRCQCSLGWRATDLFARGGEPGGEHKALLSSAVRVCALRRPLDREPLPSDKRQL